MTPVEKQLQALEAMPIALAYYLNECEGWSLHPQYPLSKVEEVTVSTACTSGRLFFENGDTTPYHVDLCIDFTRSTKITHDLFLADQYTFRDAYLETSKDGLPCPPAFLQEVFSVLLQQTQPDLTTRAIARRAGNILLTCYPKGPTRPPSTPIEL